MRFFRKPAPLSCEDRVEIQYALERQVLDRIRSGGDFHGTFSNGLEWTVDGEEFQITISWVSGEWTIK